MGYGSAWQLLIFAFLMEDRIQPLEDRTPLCTHLWLITRQETEPWFWVERGAVPIWHCRVPGLHIRACGWGRRVGGMRACLGENQLRWWWQDGAPDVESSPEVLKDRHMAGVQAAGKASLHGTLWLTVPPTEPDSHLGRKRVNKA